MEHRPTIIAGNWKMYKTIADALAWVKAFQQEPPGKTGVEVAIFAPFTALHAIAAEVQGGPLILGAQDIYPGTFGAFTGEVSGPMLRDAGAQWVLIGHSERRQFFHESHDLLAAKLRSAMEWGLRPVYCVGETLAERDSGSHFQVVASQLNMVLSGLDADQASRIVIAYEPVWAIGTGKTASAEEAEEMHRFIRHEMQSLWGPVSRSIPILYGGSVKPANAAELFRCDNIDGALVGGASLDPQDFKAILASA